MRKFAKLLSMLLVVATIASLCAISASAAAFKDISAKDEALYEAVQLLNSLGIAKGQSETNYGANKPVTREQMAAFIYRMMKEGRSLEGGDNLTSFTDLKDPTFYGMISWASSTGVIKGISETEFNPTGKITLQDCYVMITRALGYEKDGPLGYPHEYIDVAEQIGLDENLDSDVEYTDFLNRGQVAIVLYNAFYAEMNETYEKIVIPAFERENVSAAHQFVKVETPETVCHKIYGIEKIVRRVVATPGYGLDISALGTGSEYKAYKPTGGATIDEVLIETAAIVPDEDSTRLTNEESVLLFEDLGLDGDADDYFLNDITMYVKEDGTVLAASAAGKVVTDSTMSVQSSGGEDEHRDYYNEDTKIRTGAIKFGADTAWLYNKPGDADCYAHSIWPADSDEDGRITFKAGYTWSGAAEPKFVEPEYSYVSDKDGFMAIQKSNHSLINQVASVGVVGGSKHNVQYYDTNSDGVVEYYWVQPYTFGAIVDKSGENNKTKNKHVGDSANRAVYNSAKDFPEIYVGGAKVEGGSYEHGKYVFAYVSGPANYIKIAPDDQNSAIKTVVTSPIKLVGTDYNQSQWDNGTTVYAWNSGNIIVGHVNYSASAGTSTGLVSLSSDNGAGEGFASAWRGALKIGQEWELVILGNRVLHGKLLGEKVDIAEQYAIIQYVNEDELQVVYKAGGIEMDGTLAYDNYVKAYIDGSVQLVKIADESDISESGYQDDNYFVDDGLVNSISSYTVDSKGYYTFEPYAPTAEDMDASKLADKEDATATYVVESQNFSLSKVQDKLYKFVAGASVATLDPNLEPNGMKYVNFTDSTKIVLNYIDEEGESDFVVYDINNLPNFDSDDASMEFTNAIVVIKNNKNSTTTENLEFMYCEIGGEIVDDSVTDNDYAIILGNIQTVDEDDALVNVYKTVDPVTGEVVDMKQTVKESSALLTNYDLYKLTDDGFIQNTTGGKVASLAYGSSDLVTIESFEADSNLLFVTGASDAVLVDENTVYVLFDRNDEEVTVEDSEMLSVKPEDDEDNIYYNEGETKLTAYVMTEKRSGEDFKYATLIIVATGK